MKRGYIKKAAALGTAAVLTAGMLTGCGDKAETNKNGEEIVELIEEMQSQIDEWKASK